MVAEQRIQTCPRLVPAHRAFDDGRRIVPPIDEVAEQDQLDIGIAASGIVRLDLPEKLLEQVYPAMDVADRIDPLSRRKGGPGRASEGVRQGDNPGLSA